MQQILQVCGINAVVVGDLARELREGSDGLRGEMTKAHRVQHVDKCCGIGGCVAGVAENERPGDAPWSFCRKTLWSMTGFPTHASQDSASKANVAAGLSLSGTGGSWQKSPDRTSCHEIVELRLMV